MKQHNIVACILLSLVTCGTYGIYWTIALNDKTNVFSGRWGASGGLVLLFLLITCGIYSLFWMHQMDNAVETLHNQHGEPGGGTPVVYLLPSLFGLSIMAYAPFQNKPNKYLSNT